MRMSIETLKAKLDHVKTLTPNLITNIEAGCDRLDQLQGRLYEEKHGTNYDAYVTYLEELRQFGVVAQEVRDCCEEIQTIGAAAADILQRLNTYMPNASADRTILEQSLARTAIWCEATAGELSTECCGTISESMYRIASQYNENNEFKKNLNTKLQNREELSSWLMPWVNANNADMQEISASHNPLDEALATLGSRQDSLTSVLQM